MPMMPKRVKYRKMQRRRGGKLKGVATRSNKVSFGDYGLKSLEYGRITASQIEACRLSAQRFLQQQGKFYTRIFPWKVYTKKPQQVTLGAGKGEPDYYTAIVKPGTVMFEIEGVNKEIARECFNRLAHKLPVKTMMIEKIKV